MVRIWGYGERVFDQWMLDDKICLVTGANRGIGKEIALGLAKLNARVVMLCRDEARGEAARIELQSVSGNYNIDLMICDLVSQESIRTFAEELIIRYDQLHVFVHNAGVMNAQYSETPDGIETTLAVNHLAPFLLSNLLFDMLIESGTRVITISSMAHKWGEIDFNDLMGKSNYKIDKAYNQSKLANILFTSELAERFAGTPATANSMEPGLVKTELGSAYSGFKGVMSKLWRIFMRSPEEGAKTAIYLAASPDIEGISGRHFVNCQPVAPARAASDPILANRLWEVSAELTGIDPNIKPIQIS